MEVHAGLRGHTGMAWSGLGEGNAQAQAANWHSMGTRICGCVGRTARTGTQQLLPAKAPEGA